MTDWVAACMEPDEWRLWQQANRTVTGNQRVDRPCEECPLGFALEMRAINRCNGEPSGAPEDEQEDEPMEAKEETTPDAGTAVVLAADPDQDIAELERKAVRAIGDYLDSKGGDEQLRQRANVGMSAFATVQRRRAALVARDQHQLNVARALTRDPAQLAEYVRLTQPALPAVAPGTARQDTASRSQA